MIEMNEIRTLDCYNNHTSRQQQLYFHNRRTAHLSTHAWFSRHNFYFPPVNRYMQAGEERAMRGTKKRQGPTLAWSEQLIGVSIDRLDHVTW